MSYSYRFGMHQPFKRYIKYYHYTLIDIEMHQYFQRIRGYEYFLFKNYNISF